MMTAVPSLTDALNSVQLPIEISDDPERTVDVTGLYHAFTFASWLTQSNYKGSVAGPAAQETSTSDKKRQRDLEVFRTATTDWFNDLAKLSKSDDYDTKMKVGKEGQKTLIRFVDYIQAQTTSATRGETALSKNLTRAREIFQGCVQTLKFGAVSDHEELYETAIEAGRAMNELQSQLTVVERERDELREELRTVREQAGGDTDTVKSDF